MLTCNEWPPRRQRWSGRAASLFIHCPLQQDSHTLHYELTVPTRSGTTFRVLLWGPEQRCISHCCPDGASNPREEMARLVQGKIEGCLLTCCVGGHAGGGQPGPWSSWMWAGEGQRTSVNLPWLGQSAAAERDHLSFSLWNNMLFQPQGTQVSNFMNYPFLVIQLQRWNIMLPRAGLFLALSCLNDHISCLEGREIYGMPT